jgi:hypothetical protein
VHCVLPRYVSRRPVPPLLHFLFHLRLLITPRRCLSNHAQPKDKGDDFLFCESRLWPSSFFCTTLFLRFENVTVSMKSLGMNMICCCWVVKIVYEILTGVMVMCYCSIVLSVIVVWVWATDFSGKHLKTKLKV